MLNTFLLMIDELRQRLGREDGATAVEYGVMVAAIVAVIVGVVFAIGGQVETAFNTVNDALVNSN